jgi:hypothetical protein
MGTLHMADNKLNLDEQAIQRKAYELWQLRGCPAGNPEHDWFEALRLLKTDVQGKAEQAPVPAPQTDVASVRADARALATQAQTISGTPAVVAEPRLETERPRAPAAKEKLQNGFKSLTKGGKPATGRKPGKG